MVKVNVKDNRLYASIALFLDQPKIIDLVSDLRSNLLNSDTPLPYGDALASLEEYPYRQSKEDLAYMSELNDQQEWLRHYGHTVHEQKTADNIEDELRSLLRPKNQMQRHLNLVLEQHVAGQKYSMLVLAAALFNQVTEKDFEGILLPGRFDSIKEDRKLYWHHQHKNDDGKGFGYGKVATTFELEERTAGKKIKNYTERLLDYNKTYLTLNT